MLIILILFPIVAWSYAQQRKDLKQLNLDGVFSANYGSHSIGTQVKLISLAELNGMNDGSLDGLNLIVSINHIQEAIPIHKAKILNLNLNNSEEFWTWTFIKNGMFDHYSKNGYRKDLRRSITEESNEFEEQMADMYYNDAYIKDYVHTILTTIAPPRGK